MDQNVVLNQINNNTQSHLKERGNIFGRALLHFFIKYFGKKVMVLITFPVVFYFMVTQEKVRKGVLKYWMAVYPNQSKIFYYKQIYKHYATFGDTLVDRISSHCIIQNHDADQIVCDEINNNRGIILLCSHIGGYNFYRFKLDNHKVHVIMSKGESQGNKKNYTLFDHHNRDNIELLDPYNPNTIFQTAEVLNNKGIIAIMGDRVVHSNLKSNMEIPFLKYKRQFPLGPWQLAYITQATVICIFIVKQDREYHLVYKDPIRFSQVNSQNKSIIIQNALLKYAHYIEEIVKKYPHQWFNFGDK